MKENQQLSKIINESGLQLNEAELIKQSYLPFFNQIAEIEEQAHKINFEIPTELDEKIARDLRLKTVKIRTGSEQIKDERKRIHMLKANIEQTAWNLIKSTCQLNEEVFLQVEKKREIAEKLRIENVKKERCVLLSEWVENAAIYPLGEMSVDAFNDLLNGSKLAKEAKIKAEKEIELAKLASENAAIIERQRVEQENKALKIAAELKAKEFELEQKKQAEIKAKADEALRLEREANAKKQAEIKAKADEALRLEREANAKLQAEIQAKADAERKAEALKQAEIKAKALAEKEALKAPDKEKLLLAIKTLNFAIVTGLSAESSALHQTILQRFEGFKSWANAEINKL